MTKPSRDIPIAGKSEVLVVDDGPAGVRAELSALQVISPADINIFQRLNK